MFYRFSSAWGAMLGTFLMIVSSPSVLPAQSEPFSLICMPDPQYYTSSNHPAKYDMYDRQANWLVDNKTALNIKHVIWLGDLTNDNTLTQWNSAVPAYNILDQGGISYGVVPGNHDYKTGRSDKWVGACKRNLSFYNAVVGPRRFQGKSFYGGNMGETSDHNENNYTLFSADGMDFMAIGIEYAPRKEVFTWANNLISQHPNRRVIIYTHMYTTHGGNYAGGSGTSFAMVGGEGKDIWEECAKRHSNVFMVVCGHVGDSELKIKTGLNGNPVIEMLVDYQFERVLDTGDYLGNGWLRILKFDPHNNRIYASTITVAPGDTDIFKNGIETFNRSGYPSNPLAIDHQFTLKYDMTSPMPPYSYMNDSLEFHDRSVNDVIPGDQTDPDIAEADNGDWVSTWSEDDNDNGKYKIWIRGFDPDGNERFVKSVVNTTGVDSVTASHPSIAMAADGRFVVTWENGPTAIRMRTYNADGTPVDGSDHEVVTVSAAGTVYEPDAAMDDSGNVVVTWTDDSDGNGLFQVKARGFTINTTQRFAAKTVNTIANGQQQKPVVAMKPNGDYVIAWEDDNTGTFDVNARGFFANETEKFPQMIANTATDGVQQNPAIGIDATGRFVVVWEDDTDLNNAYQIKARGFTPTGTELFADLTVNAIAAGNQIDPEVAMDSLGNWYPAWEDNGAVSGGEGYQIMSSAFDISGARKNTSDVRANSTTKVTHKFGTPDRKNPVVCAHKSGRYIVAWADDQEGDGLYQPLARGIGGTAKSLAVKSVYGQVAESPSEPFYAPGTQVQMTATPDPGHTFIRWTGDVPGSSQTANPLTVSMSQSRNVTAEFSETAGVGDWVLY